MFVSRGPRFSKEKRVIQVKPFVTNHFEGLLKKEDVYLTWAKVFWGEKRVIQVKPFVTKHFKVLLKKEDLCLTWAKVF